MTTARPRSKRPPTAKRTRKASTKKPTAKRAPDSAGATARVAASARSMSHDAALGCVRGLLEFMGDDPTREGLRETPERVLRSYAEHFSGYGQDPSEHLAKTFSEVEDYDELVLVSDIEVFSHCEHHLVPFVGKAHVAYIPDGRVVGLSKLARVVDVFAKRLQVQEKLTAQIAGAIQDHLHPLGVAVVLQCQHFCMCYRGVRKPGSWTTTSKLYGLFLSDSAARMELLTLIGLHREIGGAGGA